MSDSTPHRSQTPADGPAVGQDEWVARHAERRFCAAAASARSRSACAASPGGRGSCSSSALFSLLPAVRVERLRPPRRLRHGALHAARARAERRRRLGRAARPRLRRVLRDRRVHLRDPRLATSSAIHLPTLVAVPLFVAASARSSGLLLGLPSRRLTGDYLAIVTLFFLQLFQTLTTNGDNVVRPQRHRRPERDPAASTRSTSSATTSPSSTRASSPSRTSTSRSRSSSSSSSRCGSSTSRAPAARGARCARTRSPPRRWACRSTG